MSKNIEKKQMLEEKFQSNKKEDEPPKEVEAKEEK